MRTIIKCPHCGMILDSYAGVGGSSTIGPPLVLCPHCGLPIKTGRSEWKDKTDVQRFGYHLLVWAWWWPAGILCVFAIGLIAFLGITSLMNDEVDISPRMLLWVVPVAAVISALRFAHMSAKEIGDSKERTQGKRDSIQGWDELS